MLLLLLVYLCCNANAEFSCEHTFPNGVRMNLTALFRSSIELDYTGSDAEGFQYTMNVCGVDQHVNACFQTNSMICQYTSAGTFKQSVARWGVGPGPEWSQIDNNQGFVAKFSNGDSCTDAKGLPVDSVALLAFTCGNTPREFTVGHLSPCVFTITFPTLHACLSTTSKDAPHPLAPAGTTVTVREAATWGLTSSLLLVFLCYCCVGCLWRFKHDARGLDLIPHLAFWTGLAVLTKDACEQLAAIVRHKWEKFRTGRHDGHGQYEEVETIPFDDTDNNL